MAAIDKKRALSIQEAMEQTADFFGFDLCERIDVGGEIFEIYFRDLLDRDTNARVEAVYTEYAKCDREEITLSDGSTVPGPYKDPRTKDGKEFDLEWRLAVALWGEEKAERFVKAGGPPGLILMVWSKQRTQINERMKRDPKSFRGD